VIIPVMPELSIAVVAKDLGTTIAGQTVTPLYVVGFAGKLLEGALVLGTDVELTSAFEVKNLRAGLGFQLIENLGIRAGLVVPELNFDKYYVTVGAGFSLGGLSVDAAYVLQSEPGESLVFRRRSCLASSSSRRLLQRRPRRGKEKESPTAFWGPVLRPPIFSPSPPPFPAEKTLSPQGWDLRTLWAEIFRFGLGRGAPSFRAPKEELWFALGLLAGKP
jgi:hypothetical protein